MMIYSSQHSTALTIMIAAKMPYSFSFCFSISHFSFCASERNSYTSSNQVVLTSAVSAKASVLSTMMSSFSPRSMILSADNPHSSPKPMLSIITPFTASNFCCTRVAESAFGSFHFAYASTPSPIQTISWLIVVENSDMAKACAVLARSLRITPQNDPYP